MASAALQQLTEIEASLDYNRVALDACQQRIIELEDALREIRNAAAGWPDVNQALIFNIADKALAL